MEEDFTPEELKYIQEPFDEYDLKYIQEINVPKYGFKQFYFYKN